MRYVCRICGYVYDDAREKVPFASLPDDWKCPLCGASKADFEPERAAKSPADAAGGASGMKSRGAPQKAAGAGPALEVPAAGSGGEAAEADLRELSPGQLSALCSNLARGCEKQYKPREARLFQEIADYFAAATPPVSDAEVENVSALLLQDIDDYPGVREAADRARDRGAARVCVWGERVTRMLASLVSRYLKEGEAMLANTGVWVCSVCGFVYVGDEPPAVCPVCKVPAWKFDRIEGRD